MIFLRYLTLLVFVGLPVLLAGCSKYPECPPPGAGDPGSKTNCYYKLKLVEGQSFKTDQLPPFDVPVKAVIDRAVVEAARGWGDPPSSSYPNFEYKFFVTVTIPDKDLTLTKLAGKDPIEFCTDDKKPADHLKLGPCLR